MFEAKDLRDRRFRFAEGKTFRELDLCEIDLSFSEVWACRFEECSFLKCMAYQCTFAGIAFVKCKFESIMVVDSTLTNVNFQSCLIGSVGALGNVRQGVKIRQTQVSPSQWGDPLFARRVLGSVPRLAIPIRYDSVWFDEHLMSRALHRLRQVLRDRIHGLMSSEDSKETLRDIASEMENTARETSELDGTTSNLPSEYVSKLVSVIREVEVALNEPHMTAITVSALEERVFRLESRMRKEVGRYKGC